MNHTEVIGQILQTNDYSIFKRLNGNRGCTEARKREVLRSIKEVGQLQPIEVNENMAIIDGQARYEACKELGIPIMYHIAYGKGIDVARSANSCGTAWTANDFVNSFAEDGNDAYVLLKKACNDTGLSVSNVLVASGHKGDGARASLKLGTLKFSDEDLKAAVAVSGKCNDIRKALSLKSAPTNTFVHAVKIVSSHDKYDHSHMLQNCKALKAEYVFTGGIATMLKTFSDVYNKRLPKADRIYFEDYMRNKGANVINYNNDWFKTKDVQTLGKEAANE